MTTQDLPRRLNFGCGYDKRPGYLNVDSYAGCEPDVLILDNDLSGLPHRWFDEVLARDVLEHIERLDTIKVLLEWADLLRDGGALALQTSSIVGVASQLRANKRSFQQQFGWTQCLFGSQAHLGDFHFTGFTETTLSVQLIAAGFRVDRMWTTDHWLLNAEATKVESWTALVDESGSVDDRTFVQLAYQRALGRDPDDSSWMLLVQGLEDGSLDRRAVMLHVSGSTERLYRTAALHGYETGSRVTQAQMVKYVPNAWKPALRSARRTVREARRQTRRAVGSIRAR